MRRRLSLSAATRGLSGASQNSSSGSEARQHRSLPLVLRQGRLNPGHWSEMHPAAQAGRPHLCLHCCPCTALPRRRALHQRSLRVLPRGWRAFRLLSASLYPSRWRARVPPRVGQCPYPLSRRALLRQSPLRPSLGRCRSANPSGARCRMNSIGDWSRLMLLRRPWGPSRRRRL